MAGSRLRPAFAEAELRLRAGRQGFGGRERAHSAGVASAKAASPAITKKGKNNARWYNPVSYITAPMCQGTNSRSP